MTDDLRTRIAAALAALTTAAPLTACQPNNDCSSLIPIVAGKIVILIPQECQ